MMEEWKKLVVNSVMMKLKNQTLINTGEYYRNFGIHFRFSSLSWMSFVSGSLTMACEVSTYHFHSNLSFVFTLGYLLSKTYKDQFTKFNLMRSKRVSPWRYLSFEGIHSKHNLFSWILNELKYMSHLHQNKIILYA